MANEYTLGGPPPQSRSEKILMNKNPGPAQSRIEELLKNSSSGRISGALVYKGTVETSLSLPSSSNEVGDVYHVNSDGSEWAWNGEEWDELGRGSAVLYTQQSLTPAQKSQARTNIGAGTYSSPIRGIPKSDLAQDVQSSLGKADTAVQPSAISGMATETWVENKGYQTAPFEIEVTQSGLTYSTTASAADILAHIDNCVLVEDGTVLQQALHQVFGSYAVILFANNTSVLGYIANASFVVTIDGSNVSVDYYSADAQPELPSVTASDNGKFLRVVNGAWAAETVQIWQGGSY